MGFFSTLFKATTKPAKVKQPKRQKVLSFAEEQLELQIQQYESETSLIYKKIKAPSGKVYQVDIRVMTPDQKVYIDRQGVKDCADFELPDWYEKKSTKRVKALILMFYTPESGITEHRAVEIRCFDIEQNYFYGFCFLREPYLTFRFDRVGEVVDLSNGNTQISDLKLFLSDKIKK